MPSFESAPVGHDLESFSQLIHTDEVAHRLSSLMQISDSYTIESAFATYHSGAVSEVIYPDVSKNEHVGRGGLQIDQSPIMGSHFDGTKRHDVTLNVHTHPVTENHPDGKPWPSTTDMSFFRVRTEDSPGLVGGVLSWGSETPIGRPGFSLSGMRNALRVMRGGEAILFLSRHNPHEYARTHNMYYMSRHGYGPDQETWNKYTAHADSHGINWAQLTVHPRTGKVLDDSQLPHLFYTGSTDVPRDARL